MASVTQRIAQISQPQGGYLPTKSFVKIPYNDGKALSDNENLHASITGIAVDYLTRFMLNGNAKKAFSISLLGAERIFKTITANQLLSNIKGIDDVSIISACKLAGFDVCFRSSVRGYKPIEEINPNQETIINIRIMVKRGLEFFKNYGKPTHSGFTFRGAYTFTVSSGDGDFCTRDTLWDFKVSKRHITPKHTLQILMYYILGMHSSKAYFKEIKNLGFFNPRLNIVYLCPISSISIETINAVETDVIGYHSIFTNSPFKTRYTEQVDDYEISVNDMAKSTNSSKNDIYKAIHNGTLSAHKKGNKYLISKSSADDYHKQQLRQKMILISLGIGIATIILLGAIFMITGISLASIPALFTPIFFR